MYLEIPGAASNERIRCHFLRAWDLLRCKITFDLTGPPYPMVEEKSN